MKREATAELGPAMLTTLLLAAGVPASWAGGNGNGGNADDEEQPFDEAQLFFELNHTDGDLGIHGLVDGDAWKRLEIEDPSEREMLNVWLSGRLRKHGLTEIFFESAEPTFDELPPAQFFRRFPAGPYEISGVTLQGQELESIVEISHVMPAPPQNVLLSGVAAAENCDAEPLPQVSAPVTISWDPVTTSHPDLGASGKVNIAQYQLVVEREEPTLLVLSVDLPPEITSFQLPGNFTTLGDAFKFEILVRDENGNRTAVESCFELQ